MSEQLNAPDLVAQIDDIRRRIYELERRRLPQGPVDVDPASTTANFVYIACTDGTTAEKAQAQIQLTGTNDDVLINAALVANPGGKFIFSSGTVHLAAQLLVNEGQGLRGSYVTNASSPFYTPTTIAAEAAAVNFGGSTTDPVVIQVARQGSSIEDFTFTYNATFSSGTTTRAVFGSGSSDCQFQTYRNLNVSSAFTHLFRIDALHAVGDSLLDRIETLNTIAIVTAGSGGFSSCVFLDVFKNGAATISQTLILGSCFVNCSMASTTPINGNGILPISTGAIGAAGAIGGDLTGSTYPTLNVAGVAAASLDIKIGTAGKGYYVKEGTNATMGVATLVAGTVVVSTNKVTASSRIHLTVQSLGTVTVPSAVGVTARTAGTSFTITSAAATDTSVVAWIIVEPA